MNYQVFVLLSCLALISLVVSCLNWFRYSTRTILSVSSMVLFGILSQFVWNVEQIIVSTDGTISYTSIFRTWESETFAWLLYTLFIIALIVFLINMFLTFMDYKEHKQNGRMTRKFDGNRDNLYD